MDTHAHLDLEVFAQDREAVLQRAWESGVRAVIIPALDAGSAARALWVAEQFATQRVQLFVAVGVHPNLVAQAWEGEQTLRELRRLARHPRVVAVGEIGLDYYRQTTPPEQQREALQAQLDLAGELGLPVILHQRESIDELLDILAAWVQGLDDEHPRGVLHSFSGGPEHARRAIALGFAVGISGPVTFKNGERMRQVVRAVALEDLLIETDSPFLAPVPYRGKRNEPAWVRYVAERIALEKGVTVDDVGRATSLHAVRRFRLPMERFDPALAPP